jgi:phytoene synthase
VADGDWRVARDLVRRYDRDRYWAALFAPAAIRAPLLTLYAYNVELSRIPEQVHEAMFGEVRLQWWRDALDGFAAGAVTGHPIADALAQIAAAHGLPLAELEGMIEARIFDLNRDMTPDMAALARYLDATAGAVFRLGCRIAGASMESINDACAAAALAYGMTGLLRALPYHAARGKLFLPAAHFAANQVDPYALLRGEAPPQLDRALSYLRAGARRHLADFRESARSLPKETRPVFLPITLVEPYLDELARSGHRPLLDIAELNPAARLWRIARAHRKGVV